MTSIVDQPAFNLFVAERIEPKLRSPEWKCSETPEADLRAVEKLLGMKENTMTGKHTMFHHIDENGEDNSACACGRVTSFLDITTTALKVHSKDFIKRAFDGQMGFIVTSIEPNITCFGCGTARGRSS
jgi:hypothetical protein